MLKYISWYKHAAMYVRLDAWMPLAKRLQPQISLTNSAANEEKNDRQARNVVVAVNGNTGWKALGRSSNLVENYLSYLVLGGRGTGVKWAWSILNYINYIDIFLLEGPKRLPLRAWPYRLSHSRSDLPTMQRVAAAKFECPGRRNQVSAQRCWEVRAFDVWIRIVGDM